MDNALHEAELAKLIQIEGDENTDALLNAVFCHECRTNSMKAAPVLGGLI